MGALLRALLDTGETQTKIADALGVDQTYVSQLAKAPNGTPRGIGAELVRKMLEEYRIDPWYFFDFPADKIPDWTRYVIDRGRLRPTSRSNA